MRSRRRRFWHLAASTAVSIAAATNATAQTPFYKGKRVTVLVNFIVGGGADLEGRLFAKYLAKHLEGQPNIIVQNMEGAGGLVGANFLGEAAPKDGTYIGYFSSAAGLHLTEPERWRADLRAYEFAAYVPGTSIGYVRTDVPPGIKVAKDRAGAKGVILGGRSANSPSDIGARLALDMLDVSFGYVTGYRSAATGRLALQRGEINLFTESPAGYRSAVEPQLVKTGQAIPLWYHLTETSDPPSPRKEISGLDIASFPQLHKSIKGTLPTGKLWDVYQALINVN
jgi:tripartite-type tricarboxylate transporter receptor subunit TctC